MINGVLKDLKPSKVFEYFEELTQIPRESGNEKGVSDYLVKFAKEHNLEVVQDEALNVVIRKKATKGYEDRPAVVIQGHMDMVCEKNTELKHDFTKDPLKLRLVDDMIYATDTTLGADDGIAVAMGMAILASEDVEHPDIELLVTTSEETGMDGAAALDPKNVNGRILINADSELEGEFLVSCAGGTTAKVTVPVLFEKANSNMSTCRVMIKGLKGGHSGDEIDKGRANSNKLLGRILNDLNSSLDFRISSLNGGSKHNAIPREADAVILVDGDAVELLKEKALKWDKIFKDEFRVSDAGVRVEFEVLKDKCDTVFSKEAQDNVINFIYLISNGINTMSMDIKGLVESSQNLGIVTTSKDGVEFVSSIRSSVNSLKQELFDRVTSLAELIGAKVERCSDYPEWSYDPNSKIREVFVDVYKRLYKKEPLVNAIHAGVECGLFKAKFGNIDMISFGPSMYDVHTPNEHISISSVSRSWDFLLEVLKEIK